MGLIATMLEFIRTSDGDAELTEVKCDPGGADNLTGTVFQPAGLDAQPLADDYVLLVPGPQKGSFVVAGYLDPNNAGVSRPGDVRLYVRDGQGAVQGELHLTQDGEEPDWQATAGALIARADRSDDELSKVKDVLDDLKTAINTHKHAIATGCQGSAAILAPNPANPATKSYSPQPTGADKGWVT